MDKFINSWKNFLTENQRPVPDHQSSGYESKQESIGFEGYASSTDTATGNRGGFLTEEEVALLAESRVDDAKKKYPGVIRFADRLANLDPSKNNKYLMWMMKQLNLKMHDNIRIAGDDAPTEEPQDAYFTDLFNYAVRLGDAIEDFHKNVQRIKNKDINSYKTLEDVENVNRELGFSKRQKRKGEKIKALEDTEIIMENDYFYVARPYTVEAAAELGNARSVTSWCIARGCALEGSGEEYFTEYTGKGKSFYYIISRFLPKENNASIQALTFDINNDLEWMNNRDNDSIDEGDLHENIKLVLFAGAVSDPEEAYDVWNDLDTGEPTPEIIQKVITGLVNDFGDEHDESIEDVTDVDEIYDIGERLFSLIYEEITENSRYHAEENPAGPLEADYQEILDEYENESHHVYIHLQDPHDYGGDQWSWSSGVEFELPEDMKWIDTGDGQPMASDYEDEILEIFEEKIDTEGATGNVNDKTLDEESIRFDFSADYGEEEGVEGFKDFCNSMRTLDDAYDKILSAALEEIELRGYVESEAHSKRKALLESLPDFKNFDTKLEKGIIKIFTKFDIDLSGFLKAVKFLDLKDDRDEEEKREAVMSTTQRMYVQRQTRNVERELSGYGSQNSVVANDWIAEMAIVFKKATAQAQKQMELPLQEAQKWEPLVSVPQLQFLAANITVTPGEKIIGTILFELTIKLHEQKQQETIRFITWVDRHFNDAMNLLRKSILQTAELRGKTAKREEPQLFIQTPEDIEQEQERQRQEESYRREGNYLMRTPGGIEEKRRRDAGLPPEIYDPQAERWIPAHPAWEIGMLDPGEPLPEDWTYSPGDPTPRRNPEGLDENKQNKLVTHKVLFENWRRFLK